VGATPSTGEQRPGGGGGGGQVLVMTEPGGFSGLEFIHVSGGLDGLNLTSGSPGQIVVLSAPVPEPGGWLAMGLGVVGSVLWARRPGGLRRRPGGK
jgi:hypothetical protein